MIISVFRQNSALQYILFSGGTKHHKIRSQRMRYCRARAMSLVLKLYLKIQPCKRFNNKNSMDEVLPWESRVPSLCRRESDFSVRCQRSLLLVNFNTVGRRIDSGRRESIPLCFEKKNSTSEQLFFLCKLLNILVLFRCLSSPLLSSPLSSLLPQHEYFS